MHVRKAFYMKNVPHGADNERIKETRQTHMLSPDFLEQVAPVTSDSSSPGGLQRSCKGTWLCGGLGEHAGRHYLGYDIRYYLAANRQLKTLPESMLQDGSRRKESSGEA